MSQSLSRRRWLKWAGTAAVVGGVSVAAYYGLTSPTMPATTTTIEASSTASVYSTPATSLGALTDYLKSNGVPDVVAEMASSYGTLDTNKKELADLVIGIKDIEPTGVAPSYQQNLLSVLVKEDPSDISAERLGTLRYMFSDQSLAINMLGFGMYPGVFDYLELVISKYPDVDKRIVYSTLGIPRFQKVSENKELFEAILQRGTDQQFKPVFDQMLSEGNVDKSKFAGPQRGRFTAIWTPMESWIWEYLDSDKKADGFLKSYAMKALVSDSFRNSKASGNYKSEEWGYGKDYGDWETAVNRLGFNSWIAWKWVKDNMTYDSSLPPCCGDDIGVQDIYYSRKGVCRHAAYFMLHALGRGAVPVAVLAINFQDNQPSGYKWHAIAVERKSDGFWNVMDFEGRGAQPITGPFTSCEEAVKNLIEGWNRVGSYRATLIRWNLEAENDVW
jgi:hypothetical protein